MARSGRNRVEWDDRRLARALMNFPAQVDRGLIAIMAYEAPRATRAMRSGAPWTDQTGNARSGLSAKPFSERFRTYGIDLSHGVPYGIWLEVRFSGRYAIIQPTIPTSGNEVMATVATLFSRLSGGA